MQIISHGYKTKISSIIAPGIDKIEENQIRIQNRRKSDKNVAFQTKIPVKE